MKKRTGLSVFIYLALLMFGGVAVGFSDETAVTLPTNDDTSSFNVKKNDGTDVFKVDGSGRMTGDGSGLSNVRPIIVFSNGDDGAPHHSIFQTTPPYFTYQGRGFVFLEGYIPGLNLYEAQIMKELTINCPGPGTILAQATGYADWRSTDEDLIRIWFYPHPSVSPTGDWETPDFHNLVIVSDYQCADRTDQYTSWSISRCYTVAGPQAFTVRICADKPWTSSAFVISDIDFQLMFFPQ